MVDVRDVANSDAEFFRPETRDLLRGAGIQSFAGIPLTAGNEPVGVLYVSYKECRTFSEEDRIRLGDFATYAALSLKKARLLNQVEKAKKAARVVARVTALGEETLHHIAQETKQVLACDAVVLFVYDELTRKLDHPPTMVGVWHPDRASQFEEVQTDSIVYKMLEREGPYIVDDPKDDLFKTSRFARDERIRTFVAIPLKTKTQTVGVMFVNYRMPYRISSDDEATILLLADQAAVAIVNAQLHERVTKRARALQAIHEAGVAVTRTLELNEILGRIAEQAWRLAGCADDPIGSIWLTDAKGVKLVAAYPREMLNIALQALGEDGYFMPQNFGRIGIIGRAIKSKTSQLVPNVDDDADFVRLFPGICQQLAVPITAAGEVIGVISVEHPRRGAFDDGDRDSLESLAAWAAVAIQNARRFEDLERIKGYVGSRQTPP